MRSKIVIRYYCDHCSKGMFKKPAMIQHEATCTLNPGRGCWLCETTPAIRSYTAIAKEAKKRPDVVIQSDPREQAEDTWNVTDVSAIKWIFKQVDQCPVCVLAVLRQGKIFAFEHFDYKEAVREWHREQTVEHFGALNRTFD